MAIVTTSCPRCDRTASVAVAQQILFGSKLVWSESLACSACGYRHEADDYGYPPNEYRDAILASEGVWTVVVLPGSDRRAVASVLRGALGLELREAVVAARSACAAISGWWKGTECEAAWLVGLLAERGVRAQRVPLERVAK